MKVRQLIERRPDVEITLTDEEAQVLYLLLMAQRDPSSIIKDLRDRLYGLGFRIRVPV